MTYKEFRKLFVFFKSMKFGIALLLMIMGVSIIGTVLPQGMDEHFYISNYSAAMSKLIFLLGFDNIYDTKIFGALFFMLVINLSMCSIFRIKKITKIIKTKPKADTMKLVEVEGFDVNESKNCTIYNTFRKHGFKKYSQDIQNTDTYYSIKNKTGYFGSWFLHFGILLVIVCYAYGHITYFSEGFYGVPGTVQSIKGTDYYARINNFNIEYEEGAVKQYTSDIELIDGTGKPLKSSQVAVNDPMRYKGYNFYQTGYGWTVKCNVLKKGNVVLQDTVYEENSLNFSAENIGIYFNKFYPDYASSSAGFSSLSDQLNNPVVLYAVLYMGNVVKMDIAKVDDIIKWNEYEFIFHSPQRYTYLEVNKMNGQSGAALGAILVIIGLMFVFYCKPSMMMICIEDEKIYVYKSLIKEIPKNTNIKEKDIYAE